MSDTGLQALFLPAENRPKAEVLALAERLREKLQLSWFDAVPSLVVVLTPERQIVYSNSCFNELTRHHDADGVVGMRLGEALGCENAETMAQGCGASPFCPHCGAGLAILQAVYGEEAERECLMRRRPGSVDEALNLRVFAKPIRFEDQNLVLVTAMDAAPEKRLDYLEHNMLAPLVAERLRREAQGPAAAFLDDLTSELADEALYLRDLAQAEAGTLKVLPRELDIDGMLAAVVQRAVDAGLAEGRELRLDNACGGAVCQADPRILGHVLRNLLTNALEAAPRGAPVDIGCSLTSSAHTFWVENPGDLTDEAAKNIYRRFFTTKGGGRGLGTYAAKLFMEWYLGGSLSFDVRQGEDGPVTAFRAHLPRREAG